MSATPPSWTPTDKPMHLQPIEKTSAEYKKVYLDLLHSTPPEFLAALIIKSMTIQRIQNPLQYSMFETFVQHHAIDNCKFLYHGCTKENSINIANNGFNRSYSGQHGTMLGRGCYFTSNAWYAMQNIYAQTDHYFVKTLIVAKVAVGKTCPAHSLMVEPPPVFHSAINDRKDICVTFKDYQAYPYYIVQFNMKPVVDLIQRAFTLNRTEFHSLMVTAYKETLQVRPALFRDNLIKQVFDTTEPWIEKTKEKRALFHDKLLQHQQKKIPPESMAEYTKEMSTLFNDVIVECQKTCLITPQGIPNMQRLLNSFTGLCEIVDFFDIVSKAPAHAQEMLKSYIENTRYARQPVRMFMKNIIMFKTFSDVCIKNHVFGEIKYQIYNKNLYLSLNPDVIWFHASNCAAISDTAIAQKICTFHSPMTFYILPYKNVRTTAPPAKRARKAYQA